MGWETLLPIIIGGGGLAAIINSALGAVKDRRSGRVQEERDTNRDLVDRTIRAERKSDAAEVTEAWALESLRLTQEHAIKVRRAALDAGLSTEIMPDWPTLPTRPSTSWEIEK